MCKITSFVIDGRTIHMADIKQKYVWNIINAAQKCDYIDKIILFGSSLEDRCRDDSDIDLAIFGNQPEGKCLTSKNTETLQGSFPAMMTSIRTMTFCILRLEKNILA